METLNPKWKPMRLSVCRLSLSLAFDLMKPSQVATLCNNDYKRPIKIECFDWVFLLLRTLCPVLICLAQDKRGPAELIGKHPSALLAHRWRAGEFTTSLNDWMDAKRLSPQMITNAMTASWPVVRADGHSWSLTLPQHKTASKVSCVVTACVVVGVRV